ncbi:hypothetical protein SORBI_3006G083050 [Sorghum bicolor]|uniref:Uncharacterized protein n=1 Tax=Sorghum bicolor TaxID=4558 RepID=A0A1Z5RDM6_SORBI|nr:hypothetical protein SORBI_3006G083050 [Sorghum bicolor]
MFLSQIPNDRKVKKKKSSSEGCMLLFTKWHFAPSHSLIFNLTQIAIKKKTDSNQVALMNNISGSTEYHFFFSRANFLPGHNLIKQAESYRLQS